MSRYAPLAGLLLVTACAAAGSGGGGGPADAPPATDAPRPVDAPVPIDAAADLCPGPVTCATAPLLGQVSGDTGNMKLTAMGHQSTWFRVRVTEDDSDVFGVSLRAAAKLTSPAGVDFDVFVYLNAGSDVIECSTTVGTTTTNGAVNQVRAEWGEGAISNGSSDSRTVSVEIRPISGTCDPARTWQLEVEGNWN